jgi:hypothetical protein
MTWLLDLLPEYRQYPVVQRHPVVLAFTGLDRLPPVVGHPGIDAVGWSSPTLDTGGYTVAEWGAVVGDTMILAAEYTAATPDPAAAKVLLLQQYDSLKNGS